MEDENGDNVGIPSQCTDDDFCASLETRCQFVGAFALILDIDTDDDGLVDAFSVGLRLTVAPSQIDGLADGGN